jgi:beta-glucosidase-like glycosyl hydrolase
MFHLGLFENPYTDPDKAQAIANSPASAARADEAHRKSIVLLRNDKKLLPIKGARKIYVETFAEAAAGTAGRGGGRGRGAFGGRGDIAGAARGEGAADGRGAGPQAEGGRRGE